MSKIKKLVKVGETFIINRYDNGYMVEIWGRDSKETGMVTKTLCTTEEEILALFREYSAIDLDR